MKSAGAIRRFRPEVSVFWAAALLLPCLLTGAQSVGGSALRGAAAPAPGTPAPPGSADEFFKQGNSFSRLEKWREAVEAYRKALEVRPDYFEAHYNLANAY